MTRKPLPARRPIQLIRLVLWLLVAVAIAGTLALVFLAPGKKMTASAIGGPFSLVDQNGATVTEAALKGHPSLMFFGYTFCPDVCPTTLLSASNWLKALGPDGDRLKVYFVTVDPERDTVSQMKAYLQAFDPRIVGLSGDRPAIDATIKAYRAYAKKVPLKDGDYTMDHTALVYLMDKDGSFIGAFNIEQAPAQAAAEWLRHS